MSYIGQKPANKAIVASDLDPAVITGQTALAVAPADTDEFLISDAGVLKRLDASLVGVSAADLVSIRQDIASLALHSAVEDNKAAFDLPNTFIDQFQDDTGIGTETDGDRYSGEYWTTVSTSIQDASSYSVGGGNIVSDSNLGNAQDGDGTTRFAYTTGSSVSGYATFDFGASYTWLQMDIGKYRGHGDGRSILITSSTDDSSYSNVDFTSATSTVVSYTGSQPNLSNFTSSGTADWAALSSNTDNVVCRVTGFPTFTARYLRYKFGSADFHDPNAGFTEFKWTKVVASATGTLIGIANVPSSARTSVSGVINYKNASGTATLGTDLKVYFTCNGGTNWTEAASYTAVTPVFSSGIKMVKLGATTCTSGSDVRYKAVWANQAVGSKVTELYGVGVNY